MLGQLTREKAELQAAQEQLAKTLERTTWERDQANTALTKAQLTLAQERQLKEKADTLVTNAVMALNNRNEEVKELKAALESECLTLN